MLFSDFYSPGGPKKIVKDGGQSKLQKLPNTLYWYKDALYIYIQYTWMRENLKRWQLCIIFQRRVLTRQKRGGNTKD